MPTERLKALKDFLEDARKRITFTAAFPDETPRTGRRSPYITQAEVEYAAGWHDNAYKDLISGRNKNPSEQLLRDIAKLFQFNEDQWNVLWNLALRAAPPTALHEDTGLSVSSPWDTLIRSSGHIAYATSRSWDLLAWSPAFARIYEGREWPGNMLLWMLTADEARGHPDKPEITPILTDWATCWAPYVLPQLRAARALFPDDATLAGIEAKVLADPLAGPLYEAREHAAVHLDGAERPQWLPYGGPDGKGAHGWVQICAADANGARIVGVIWTPDRPSATKSGAVTSAPAS